MLRQNALEDFQAHNNLKGAIFRRKATDKVKLTGLAYFGAATVAYMQYPVLAAHFGSTLTTAGVFGSLFTGMTKLQEKNVVNSIEFEKDSGKLKFNVSTGPLMTSKDIYAEPHECQAVFSLGEDNLETEANLV